MSEAEKATRVSQARADAEEFMRLVSGGPGLADAPGTAGQSSPAFAEARKDVDAVIGDRIRLLRQDRRWTQQDLADRLGVTRAQVSSWEAARVSVYAGDLPRLGRVMGVPTSWFLGAYAPLDPLQEALNGLGVAERDMILAQVQTFRRNRGR